MYSGDLFVPIFGFGAKTFDGSTEACNVFPMSMNMSNPLIPNQEESLEEAFSSCYQTVQPGVIMKLNPLLSFLKATAHSLREKQEKAYNDGQTLARFPQIFYQAHVLMTGEVDDISEVLKTFECSQWACLPIQICFINLAEQNEGTTNHPNEKLGAIISKYNREVAGWLQVKAKSISSSAEYESLVDELSWALPRDIEDYIFVNQLSNV